MEVGATGGAGRAGVLGWEELGPSLASVSPASPSPLLPIPASSPTRSPTPRSSGGRSSDGRSWQSGASCHGRCAGRRPDSSALPQAEPGLDPQTPLRGPSTISGPTTVSATAVTRGWAVVQVGHPSRTVVSPASAPVMEGVGSGIPSRLRPSPTPQIPQQPPSLPPQTRWSGPWLARMRSSWSRPRRKA